MTTPPLLTRELFDAHMNEVFRIALSSGGELELKLIESRAVDAGGIGSKERKPFAIVFGGGPPDRHLPQRTYDLVHPELGTLQVFIVPLGPQGGEMRYEAIFT